VTATCPSIRAHWRHLANTIELVHPSAHSSSHSKRQMDRFSRFCTAYARKCLYFTMGAPIPHLGTLCLTVSMTLILLCKPSNAILRLSFFLHTSTFSAFEVSYKNALYKSTVIIIIIRQNCPFPWGIWTSHVTRDAFGPCEPTTQTAP